MKKHLLRLAFINGLLFLSICIFAQEYSDFYFTRVNGENGLSESNVKAILQDSYGFMWFGTKNGLNRYGLEQTGVFIYIIRRSMYLNVSK